LTQVDDPEDPWLDAVRRALVPIEPLATPSSDEQRAQAAKMCAAASKDIGTGIDPAAVLHALERFAAALRVDLTCVDGYLGIGRAAQLLAAKKPRLTDPICSALIEWLRAATTRLGPIQSSGPVHDLEAKLRELRAEARSRPKADADVEVDVVRVDRDREGRARPKKDAPRFRPPSEVLKSLMARRDASLDDPARVARVAFVRALVGVVGIAALLGLVVWAALSSGGDDRPAAPAWPDPTLAARVQEAVALARPLLEVDAPLEGAPPAPAAVVAETTGPDPLHATLPDGVGALAADVRSLVVVRRYAGPSGHLLLAWVVDLEAPGRVVARASFAGGNPGALDAQARAWLASLSWRRP
jgi:hypothetical protein